MTFSVKIRRTQMAEKSKAGLSEVADKPSTDWITGQQFSWLLPALYFRAHAWREQKRISRPRRMVKIFLSVVSLFLPAAAGSFYPSRPASVAASAALGGVCPS